MSRRGIDVELYSFLNIGARCGGWSTPHPGRFNSEKDPVPIVIVVVVAAVVVIVAVAKVLVVVLVGDRGSTVVKVLCYKSEGRWFDSRWCHWNFSLT
jgi:hypothetical protein